MRSMKRMSALLLALLLALPTLPALAEDAAESPVEVFAEAEAEVEAAETLDGAEAPVEWAPGLNTGGGIIEEEALADAAGADGVELADALADAPAGEEARGEDAGANGAEAPAAANEAAGTVNAPHTHNGELNESTDEHEGWTAWGDTDEQKTSLPTEPGRYYLTADVTLSAK